ncbi:MAG: WYL domain-containing protein [Arcanobacterium sp.]|nr:WYL domain-containing protein [Arcanobacterium sp.]
MGVALTRKIALLQYLLENAPVTLRSLAESFKCPPRELHAELISLFTTELIDGEGFISPINLEFDLDFNPDDVVDIALEIDPGAISLSYSEILALLVVIDSQIKVAAESDRVGLLRIRALITQALAEHTRFSQLWPAPEKVYSQNLVKVLNECIAQRQMVKFNYWKHHDLPLPGVEDKEVQCFPLAIIAGHPEFLEAVLADGQIRRYRLERISDVQKLSNQQTTRENTRLRAQAKREIPNYQGTLVRLHCSQDALWISEVIPQVEVRKGERTAIILEITVRSRQVLREILVRLGDSVKLIETSQVDFIQEMSQDFQNLLTHYEAKSESEVL